ncbi:bifunctional heptose 7-phosphate kinase/heptose 1-phosphate adenyltransferase [Spirosoma utsteinense]|uniref:RfaE bifunctional protein kinase chain/domain n=1 Tax=Spirosoma utsteinense TaxID=2585773 RepID=A0ABR6VZU4_9BACT|nr:PfkB family carbohydrate kinase [Spirosoma utsteinense]MBC3786493.1 rfaE bifunctional protein kinase chain/domain [Spirosoma utsteinense]MBC3789869.1 rfaE bifunctional protein kinase chain/domain [Spirosoma utsteinense]
MTTSEISTLFEQLTTTRVGVIGDFALDLYFTLQTTTGERSLETNLDVFWGSRPAASLGGAGNVVQNLMALGIANCRVIGCVGNDLFGREMQFLLNNLGVDTAQLHTVANGWDTCVYTKPLRAGQEVNRIDFGVANQLPDALFTTLIAGLQEALADLDVLIINQQFANPLLTPERVAVLNALLVRFPHVRCVADMRDVGTLIRGATLKVNTAELAKFLAIDLPHSPDLDWCIRNGTTLREQTGGPLLITRGQAGMLYLDEHETQSVAGLPLWGELDTVGAGDTVVAAWAACRGAGATPAQAVQIANMAAAVTVQKVNQTGTASLAELLLLYETLNPMEHR